MTELETEQQRIQAERQDAVNSIIKMIMDSLAKYPQGRTLWGILSHPPLRALYNNKTMPLKVITMTLNELKVSGALEKNKKHWFIPQPKQADNKNINAVDYSA